VAFDEDADARRVRWAFLVAALAALAALVAAGLRSSRAEWRRHQRDFVAAGLALEPPGIVEVRACDGTVDRCTTCHLAMERPDLDGRRDLPPPLSPHPVSLEHHPPHVVGCTSCHGGTGRALDRAAAHAVAGTGEPDPLRGSPDLQASCARCHVPGVAGSERLARGADLYLRLGCAMCHSLRAGGRGGWDYGPDLRSLGRQGLATLRESVLEPAANFPGSTMPSYAASFAHDPEALDDLLVFVQGLTLEPACWVGGAGELVGSPCSSCHAGEGGVAAGRMQHRCSHILARRDQLVCSACHSGPLPEAGAFAGFCPMVREHRGACAACHARGLE
jgi:mono/diheme cytochrome c family protein